MKNEDELIKIIENVNEDLLIEKYNKMKSNKIKLIMNCIKTNNIKFAIQKITNNKRNEEKTKKIKASQKAYQINSDSTNKIAVYTCITGNYDQVYEPIMQESCCDYYLFTNNPKIKSTNWEIKKIPEKIEKLNNNILINRYIKMHPYELFPNYDYSIYIDGNITIVSKISDFTTSTKVETGIGLHEHYKRKCAYDEMKICEIAGKGDWKKIKKQEKEYKQENFPENFGFWECNVIAADLNNKNGQKILDAWWNEFLKSESMRDQICLPYVLWKNNYNGSQIGVIGENVFLNNRIRINKHKQ